MNTQTLDISWFQECFLHPIYLRTGPIDNILPLQTPQVFLQKVFWTLLSLSHCPWVFQVSHVLVGDSSLHSSGDTNRHSDFTISSNQYRVSRYLKHCLSLERGEQLVIRLICIFYFVVCTNTNMQSVLVLKL